MPERVYMGRDWRRDHGFTSPDPHLSMKHGIPNACSNCHEEQGDEWAKAKVDEWYGDSERKAKSHRRADALRAPGDDGCLSGEGKMIGHRLRLN